MLYKYVALQDFKKWLQSCRYLSNGVWKMYINYAIIRTVCRMINYIKYKIYVVCNMQVTHEQQIKSWYYRIFQVMGIRKMMSTVSL